METTMSQHLEDGPLDERLLKQIRARVAALEAFDAEFKRQHGVSFSEAFAQSSGDETVRLTRLLLNHDVNVSPKEL
jgi:hypothetical protein